MILIVITFALVLFTINKQQNIISSIEQIIFQSSYEYGNTSTGIIASRFDIIDFSQIFPYILQSVFFGIPIGLTTQYSLKTMILVGLYAFSNIISAYYIYFCIQKLYFKRLFFLNLIIFSLVFISFFISSSAFLVNTGTAFRYYSSFFSLMWLSFIHTRYN